LIVDIPEPLRESAPLAHALAPTLCRADPATGERCAWNHGLWQYLRLFGLVTTPVHHRDFFARALSAPPEGAQPARILVSGSADYAMLAEVLGAMHGRAASITVLDICETPLALNRWYAARLSQPIETQRADILAYDAAQPFDAICTHAFLAMFAPQRRPALLGRWRALLRPGGRVITVNRVRPGFGGAQAGFGAGEVRAFRDAVLARAQAMRDVLPIEPEALAREAEDYARLQRVYPVRSAEEVRALFEDGGFRIDEFTCAPIERRAQNPIAAPTVPGDADYVRVVASRR
jgi:SAM-dependent methyltransferase